MTILQLRDGLAAVALYFAVCALVSDAHAAHFKDTTMKINTDVIWHANDVEPVGAVEAIILIQPPTTGAPVVLPQLYHWDPAAGYWIGSASHLKIRHKEFRWRDIAPLLASVPAPAAWKTGEEATAELLGLVGIVVAPAIVADWTDAQVEQAEDYAGAAHLLASDNDIEVPPLPEFLTPYVGAVAS